MHPLGHVDAETLLEGSSDWVDTELMHSLASAPRSCIETEFPHYQFQVESAEITPPRERHPLFFGCFDWHSAVHSHWCLLRQLRLFDDHPDKAEIVDILDERLTDGNVAGEVAYLNDHPSFENPYGWGWFLRLMGELAMSDAERAREWRATLDPLERTVVSLVEEEFLTIDRPIRVGTHGNSAFSLSAVIDYARVTGRSGLATDAESTARALFDDDREYPVEYEPLGWDFISPALTEADLMRRVLPPAAFESWCDRFFPDLHEPPSDSLLEPERVDPDEESGRVLHLAGLNVAKAWCFIGLAETLNGHPLEGPFRAAARQHVEEGFDAVFTDEYAGAHWLISFVMYLVSRNDGGIAPEPGA